MSCWDLSLDISRRPCSNNQPHKLQSGYLNDIHSVAQKPSFSVGFLSKPRGIWFIYTNRNDKNHTCELYNPSQKFLLCACPVCDLTTAFRSKMMANFRLQTLRETWGLYILKVAEDYSVIFNDISYFWPTFKISKPFLPLYPAVSNFHKNISIVCAESFTHPPTHRSCHALPSRTPA